MTTNEEGGGMTFQLDTSGFVGDPDGWGILEWSDLDPFTQGYVEALFASLKLPTSTHVAPDAEGRSHVIVRQPRVGFRDIAPETLARIMEDCAARLRSRDCVQNTLAGGRSFWTKRQAGEREGFPPLTPALNDAGKVVFA